MTFEKLRSRFDASSVNDLYHVIQKTKLALIKYDSEILSVESKRMSSHYVGYCKHQVSLVTTDLEIKLQLRELGF